MKATEISRVCRAGGHDGENYAFALGRVCHLLEMCLRGKVEEVRERLAEIAREAEQLPPPPGDGP